MSQKHSLMQRPQLVPWALMSDTDAIIFETKEGEQIGTLWKLDEPLNIRSQVLEQAVASWLRDFDSTAALPSYVVRNTVPHTPWLGRFVLQYFHTAAQIPIIPAVECGSWNTERVQRALGWQMRLLNEPDDLQLLG